MPEHQSDTVLSMPKPLFTMPSAMQVLSMWVDRIPVHGPHCEVVLRSNRVVDEETEHTGLPDIESGPPDSITRAEHRAFSGFLFESLGVTT